MNARELMIGDMVMAHYNDGETQCDFPAVVTAIFTDRLLCNDGIQIKSISSEYSGLCDEECINIEPIPLTKEILEKNGYGEDIDNYEYGDEIEIRLNLNEWEREMETGYGWMIRYVHQFQHALRLCGFTELSDSFKI